MTQLDAQQIVMQCFPTMVSEHFTLTINSVSSYIKTIHFILPEAKTTAYYVSGPGSDT